jgi:hypothetical protein
LAWKTFFNLILDMADKGLPSRIDRSFLEKKSGLDQSYLIATMKVFGLIEEDGTVREPLMRLVSDTEGRPALVADLLKSNYPEVFALPDNATQQQLDDVFEATFNVKSATTRKAVTFFMHAAAYAGVKLSPHLKAPRGAAGSGAARSSGGARRQRRAPRQKPNAGPDTPPPTPPSAAGSNPPDMKRQYFEFLLKKAETAERGEDKELLDRIERLIGMAPSDAASPGDSQ